MFSLKARNRVSILISFCFTIGYEGDDTNTKMAKEGFTMDVPVEQTEKEKRLSSILDKGLDELAKEERENRRRERENERRNKEPKYTQRDSIRGDRSHDRRERRDLRDDVRIVSSRDNRVDLREKVLNCRISHYDLEQLAKKQGIDTRGYNIHLEAVLTPKRRF